ncbi:hypothetical protein O1W69_00235 [Chlamydia sp. 12-01]|uniref:CT392 family protein n=1 Tax=Chlamydia sp. 12-01 TaxID=3002742 RepID=UPI0035D428BF
MSSVSGSSGQNPKPIPDDPNSHLENVDNTDTSSKDQESISSGVTETGLSVEVFSAGEVSTIDAAIADIQDIASSIIAVGTPTGLPPSSAEAAGLAGEIVTDFYEEGPSKEDLEQLDGSVVDLFAGVEDSKELVDELRKRIDNFQKTKLDSIKQTSRKSKLDEDGPDLEEQFLDLRRSAAILNGRANQLESSASRLMADLADTHHTLVGLSMEEFRNIFGSTSDQFLEDLNKMGLVYEEGDWRIDSNGRVPKLTLEIQELRITLENLQIPTEEEFIKTATEESVSCCQAIINKLKTLWNTLVQMFHNFYDKMLFFLFWIAKKIRNKLQFPSSNKNEKNPKFENPFASTSGTTTERQNAASVRASVSGRSDLSDEDTIRRPEDSTIETQNVDDQDGQEKKGTENDS